MLQHGRGSQLSREGKFACLHVILRREEQVSTNFAPFREDGDVTYLNAQAPAPAGAARVRAGAGARSF